MFAYFQRIREILSQVEELEATSLAQAVEILSDAIKKKQAIFIFGASHAGILAEEMFYRAGGLVSINPIFGRELMLDTRPISATSQMERLVGYGQLLAKKTPFKAGDVLIVHSVSGRNPVAVDLALAAKEKGVYVIALTNLTYSRATKSRHPSGHRLCEVADLVLDNHGHIGDGACQVPGIEQPVGPSSTVIGSCILNHLVVEVSRNLAQSGLNPVPIFYSANLDGGDDKNRQIYETYREAIHYDL